MSEEVFGVRVEADTTGFTDIQAAAKATETATKAANDGVIASNQQVAESYQAISARQAEMRAAIAQGDALAAAPRTTAASNVVTGGDTAAVQEQTAALGELSAAQEKVAAGGSATISANEGLAASLAQVGAATRELSALAASAASAEVSADAEVVAGTRARTDALVGAIAAQREYVAAQEQAAIAAPMQRVAGALQTLRQQPAEEPVPVSTGTSSQDEATINTRVQAITAALAQRAAAEQAATDAAEQAALAERQEAQAAQGAAIRQQKQEEALARRGPQIATAGLTGVTRDVATRSNAGASPEDVQAQVLGLGYSGGDTLAAMKQLGVVTAAMTEADENALAVTKLLNDGYIKEADALIALTAATERYDKAVAAGNGDKAVGLSALSAQTKAESSLQSLQNERLTGSASGGGGGIGGFLTGFAGGFGEGPDAQSTESLGNQTAQVAKYLALYQAFRLVETGIRDAITQTVEFERSITDLSNRLDLPRDKATSLANSLASVGAPAGLSPSQSVQLGTQFAGTFQGQGTPQSLATEGTQLGAEVAVLGGGAKDAAATMEDLTAATRAFNLAGSEAPRVLDAATSAAKNFGLANAAVVLPGLAQIGDLASAAGFSVEQTANTLADLQSATGEDSAATAGELQRFFGRSGNAAFQQVFSGLGVNTLQPFNDELADLSGKFDTLTQKQKDFVTAQFGGGRAGVAALRLIEDYGNVQAATNKTVQDGGIAQQQYFARLNDIHGLLDTLKGDFEELAKNVGTSGIGAGFGVLLEALKPVLETANDLLGVFNDIPAPLREAAALVGEIALAAKLIGAINLGSRVSALGTNVGTRVTGAVNRATTLPGDRGPEPIVTGVGATAGEAASTAVDAEAAAAAAKLKAAADAEAAAQTAGAEEITLANTKVSTALADLVGIILTGSSRLKLALDEEVASLRAGAAEQDVTTGAFAISSAGAALKKGASSLFDAIGPLGLAIGGAIAIDATLNATNKINTSQAATTGSGNIDALTGAANDAGRQAVIDKQASSGIAGTLVNAILGNPTGKDAAASRQAEQTDLALKKQQQNAIDAEKGPTQASALVQLQDAADGSSGLASSLKALTDAGYTAQQQMEAVTKKLNDAAQAAAGFIPADQVPQLAAAAGSVVAKNIADARSSETYLAKSSGSQNRTAVLASGALGQLDQSKLSGVTADAISGFLRTNDASGAPLDPKQLEAEKQKVYDSLVAEAKKEGVDGQKLKAILPDLLSAAGTAVDSQLQTLVGAGQLSNQDITGIVNGLQGVAKQAGADSTTNASLAGGSGQNADLTGSQDTLALLQQNRAALEKQKNASPQDFAQIDQDIRDAQLAVQTATVANIKSYGDLLVASDSPFDKSGQIRDSLASLGQQLGATTDPAQERALEAQITQGVQQQAAQKVSDANSLRDSQVSPADSTGLDSAKVLDAKANLDAITATGVTSGQAYTDALKAYQDALYTQANDKVSEANAIRDAAIDPRDTTGTAANALLDAQQKLGELVAQGADPTQIANQQKAVLAASIASQQAAVAKQNAATGAGVRQGDPLSAASAALTEAQNSLNADLKDSTQYYTDLAAVHAAQYTLAQQIVADSKVAAENASDTTDPVQQAYIAALSAQQQLQSDQKSGTGNIGADQLAVTQANDAAQKAAFTQQLGDQSTAFSLHQESGAAYGEYLTNESNALTAQLAATRKGTDGYRQLLDELNQVTQARLALSQQFQGQFNLGSIKVPTVYDVRSAIASAAPGAGGASSPAVTNQTVTFQINGADTAKVQQIINQTLGGGSLSARGLTQPKVSVSR